MSRAGRGCRPPSCAPEWLTRCSCISHRCCSVDPTSQSVTSDPQPSTRRSHWSLCGSSESVLTCSLLPTRAQRPSAAHPISRPPPLALPPTHRPPPRLPTQQPPPPSPTQPPAPPERGADMFTGIIEERGTITEIHRNTDAARITVHGSTTVAKTRRGDSISVSGVCLTVTAVTAEGFTADIMAQTLHTSTLGAVTPG